MIAVLVASHLCRLELVACYREHTQTHTLSAALEYKKLVSSRFMGPVQTIAATECLYVLSTGALNTIEATKSVRSSADWFNFCAIKLYCWGTFNSFS